MSETRRARIERLVEAAETLAPERRAELLDAECAGDAALREEVERLLSLRAAAESFLERPAVALAAESGDWLEESAGFVAGFQVGPYVVKDALGSGGMGEVYRALDQRLRREVALKFLPRRLSQDAASLERFQREARAASALNHPNICAIYDVGEHEGQPYIVMELLEGRTLEARLAEGPLPARELAGVASQAAAALEAAHAKGIIHRDVKPANIVLTAGGTVKIVDFGVAKPLGEPAEDVGMPEESGAETITRTGVLPGTAAYMSPEQIRGEEVDARSDLFALGITLYRCATGALPFRGEDRAAVREAILHAIPVSPRKLNPALPRELERIIVRLLEKDAGRRQQSARELAVELRRWSEPGRRRKWGWAALAVAAAAALLWLVSGKEETRRAVVLPLENLTGDPAQEPLLDTVRDAVAGDLEKLRSLRVISPGPARRYGRTRKSAQEVGRELKVDLVVAGSAVREGERPRLRLQLIRAASGETLWAQAFDADVGAIARLQSEAARAAARALRQRLSAAEEARLASGGTQNREAFENYVRGRYYWSKRTDGDIERAVSFFRAAIDADPAYAAAYAALADCYNQFGTVAVGRSPAEYRPLAIGAANRAIEIDGQNAQAHAALGFARMYNWEWDAARQELDRALELNPSYSPAHVWRASWLVIHHRFAEAVADVERARDLDPLSLINQTQVGWIYQFAGREDDAIAVFRRVLAIDPDFLWALWRLGDSLAETGRLGEAIQVLEHAKAVHGDSPAILARVGRVYAMAGRRAEARRLIQRLDAMARERYVTPHARGEICLGLEDWDCYIQTQEEGYRQRTNAMAYMGVEPRARRSAALWTDQRFLGLLRRIGLRASR